MGMLEKNFFFIENLTLVKEIESSLALKLTKSFDKGEDCRSQTQVCNPCSWDILISSLDGFGESPLVLYDMP